MSSSKGPKVSSKMRKGIKLCEEVLGVKYKGKTFDEAKEFLDDNMPKIQNVDIRERREPSEKMWFAIGFIEKVLNVKFEGNNQKQASEFISSYLDKAKKESGQKGKK